MIKALWGLFVSYWNIKDILLQTVSGIARIEWAETVLPWKIEYC